MFPDNFDDDAVLETFKEAVSKRPAEADTAKLMIEIIGKARKSNRIMAAANAKMTPEGALKFLHSSEEWGDQNILMNAQIKVRAICCRRWFPRHSCRCPFLPRSLFPRTALPIVSQLIQKVRPVH
jgi:hypothetical protein